MVMVWKITRTIDPGYLRPLNDTKFYCCDYASEILYKGFTRLKMWKDAGFTYCPNCRNRLSFN